MGETPRELLTLSLLGGWEPPVLGGRTGMEVAAGDRGPGQGRLGGVCGPGLWSLQERGAPSILGSDPGTCSRPCGAEDAPQRRGSPQC